MPADRRERLAETARLLDGRGGGIDMVRFNDLFLAPPRLSTGVGPTIFERVQQTWRRPFTSQIPREILNVFK